MNKTKFMNILQIRRIEIEYNLDSISEKNAVTQKMLELCKTNWFSNMRNNFIHNDNIILEYCSTKEEFTTQELTTFLHEIGLL